MFCTSEKETDGLHEVRGRNVVELHNSAIVQEVFYWNLIRTTACDNSLQTLHDNLTNYLQIKERRMILLYGCSNAY